MSTRYNFLPRSLQIAFALLLTAGVSPALAQPTLLTPTDTQTGIGPTVSFSWSAVPGAASYHLQMDDNNDFSSPIWDANEGNVTSVNLTNGFTQDGTTYFWRVKALDGVGGELGGYPTAFSFTFATLTLTVPADAATDVSLTPTLTWTYTGPGTDTFDWDLATDAGFTTIVDSGTGSTATTEAVGPLNAATTYHWRVRPRDASGTGLYHTSSFTTAGLTLTAPADAATGQAISPTFAWTDSGTGAASYDLQYDTDPGFGTATTVSGVTDPHTLVASLAINTTYHWRILAKDAGSSTIATSAAFSFTTGNLTVTAVSTPAPLKATFAWTDTGTGAASYDLQYDTDPGFGGATTVTGVTDPHTLTTALSLNTTYHWRILAKDAGSSTIATSASSSFTTGNLTLTAPADEASDLDPNGTTFQWTDTGTGATSYRLEYALDSGFTSGLVSTVVAGTSHTATLASGTEYFWRVTAINGGDMVTVGTFFFTTTIRLDFPVNTLSGVSIEPTFDWQSVTGATDYTLAIDDDSNVSDAPLQSITVSGADELTIDYDNTDHIQFANSTTYYWQVTTTVGAATFISPVYSFETVKPAVPQLDYPSAGLVVPSTTFDYSWDVAATAPALTYALHVRLATATDWTVPSRVQNTSSIPDTDQASGGLLGGESYQWRVVSYNPNLDDLDARNGTTVSYSDVGAFSTRGGPIQPIPSWPTGGALVYSNTQLISWYLNAPGTGITYQIDLVPDSDPFVCAGVTSADPCPALPPAQTGIGVMQYVPTPALTGGVLYKWRVRAFDPAGAGRYSDWSATETFQTNGPGTPVVPTPSYPVAGLTIYNTAPTLAWYTGAPTTGLVFDLQYRECDNADCTTVTASYTDVADVATSSHQLSGLTAGKSYQWRVRSDNGTTTSAYSAETYFVIAGGTDGTFITPNWPSGDAQLYVDQPQLGWTLEGSTLGLAGFELQWDTDQNEGNGITGNQVVAGATTQSYTLSAAQELPWGTNYHWRARTCVSVAGSVCGTPGPWSVYASFTIIGQNGSLTPILTYPASGELVPDVAPTLGWYINGAVSLVDHYEVQYSLTSTFLAGVFTTSVDATAPAITYATSGLQPGSTYHWRVRSCQNPAKTSCSPYSAVGTFMTPAGAGPVQPRVGSPVTGIALQTAAPVLSWALPQASEGALVYELEYSRSEDMSGAEVVTGVSLPQVALSNLEAGTYYWRVRSVSADGNVSAYSEVGVFATSATSGDGTSVAIEEEGEVPASYALESNYPNPFNPETVIGFRVPESGFVRVAVYDALGREVSVLREGVISAGRHEVVFAASDLPSGVYVYRLEAASTVLTKTMLLLK